MIKSKLFRFCHVINMDSKIMLVNIYLNVDIVTKSQSFI